MYKELYATLKGLVNSVDNIFKDYTKTLSKSLIWIHFQNPQIGINTRFENSQTYKNSLDLTKIGHQLQ